MPYVYKKDETAAYQDGLHGNTLTALGEYSRRLDEQLYRIKEYYNSLKVQFAMDAVLSGEYYNQYKKKQETYLQRCQDAIWDLETNAEALRQLIRSTEEKRKYWKNKVYVYEWEEENVQD